MEAAWRISAYSISEKTPAVECLKIHLPGQARRFSKNDSSSQLERYFLRPTVEPFLSMTYTEYHNACVFKSLTGQEVTDDMILEVEKVGCVRQEVKLRTRGEKISRIQMMYPSAGELFYLRVLLLHKFGRSFDDLKTVDGISAPTFQEAAQLLGLIQHGDEGDHCMTEATNQLYSPRQLRFLFCELILDGSPAVALFEKFHDNLIADYIDRGVEESEDLLLSTIATFIEERGKTMSDFGLPDPVRRISEAAIFREHFGSRVGDLLAASQNMRHQMNLEQG